MHFKDVYLHLSHFLSFFLFCSLTNKQKELRRSSNFQHTWKAAPYVMVSGLFSAVDLPAGHCLWDGLKINGLFMVKKKNWKPALIHVCIFMCSGHEVPQIRQHFLDQRKHVGQWSRTANSIYVTYSEFLRWKIQIVLPLLLEHIHLEIITHPLFSFDASRK